MEIADRRTRAERFKEIDWAFCRRDFFYEPIFSHPILSLSSAANILHPNSGFVHDYDAFVEDVLLNSRICGTHCIIGTGPFSPFRWFQRTTFGGEMSFTNKLGADAATAFAAAAGEVFIACGADGFAFLKDLGRNENRPARDCRANGPRTSRDDIANLPGH
jgi:hypothetical protein